MYRKVGIILPSSFFFFFSFLFLVSLVKFLGFTLYQPQSSEAFSGLE